MTEKNLDETHKLIREVTSKRNGELVISCVDEALRLTGISREDLINLHLVKSTSLIQLEENAEADLYKAKVLMDERNKEEAEKAVQK